MNVVKTSTYVTGNVVIPVFTAAENSIININAVNSSNSPVHVTIYMGDVTPPQQAHMIDSGQSLDIGATLLRCGEPIFKGENVSILVEPHDPTETNYGVSVRVSGLFDTPDFVEETV